MSAGRARVFCDWGAAAAQRPAAVAVVVDVLSFCTAVTIAVAQGAMVYPFPWRDTRAAAFAESHGAACAGPRRTPGFSLSPGTMRQARVGQGIVLPSPNGAEVTLAQAAPVVLAGCLRNARAVAGAAQEAGGDILVVPAGERWPDGRLRVAFEDLVGAGAIIAHLDGDRAPEAEAAFVAFRAAAPDLHRHMLRAESGRELVARGFAADVAEAAALDVTPVVPVLRREPPARFEAAPG